MRHTQGIANKSENIVREKVGERRLQEVITGKIEKTGEDHISKSLELLWFENFNCLDEISRI